MTGRVVQVSTSAGGVPKHAVDRAEATPAGLAGDSWRYPFHGGPRQALLLITIEGIEELVAEGYALYPGALGENLTTHGLDRRAMRIGQRFHVAEALIELTRIRPPCATVHIYGESLPAAMYDARAQAHDPSSPRWGLSGFYASVVRAGLIRTGDEITEILL